MHVVDHLLVVVTSTSCSLGGGGLYMCTSFGWLKGGMIQSNGGNLPLKRPSKNTEYNVSYIVQVI